MRDIRFIGIGTAVLDDGTPLLCPGCILERDGLPPTRFNVRLAVHDCLMELVDAGVDVSRLPDGDEITREYLENPWHDSE